MYTKSATHFVPRTAHEALVTSLRSHNFHKSAAIHASLNVILKEHEHQYDLNQHPSYLQQHQVDIDDLFRGHSLASIKQRIEATSHRNDEHGRFAQHCRERMSRASPTALLLTFESVRRGRSSSLAQCLLFEYRILVRLVRAASSEGDFYEGVRAKILEKDNLPKWNRPMPLLHVHDMFLPLSPSEGPDLKFTEIQLIRSDTTRKILPHYPVVNRSLHAPLTALITPGTAQ
jgi:hypothetical protein